MSQHANLVDEARETIREYIWWDTEIWALGEGIDTSAHYTRLKMLERLQEIAAEIGEDRVRVFWDETRDKIRAEMREMVRGEVRPDVFEDWQAGRMSTRPAVPPEELTYEWPDPFSTQSPEPGVIEFDPELVVRDGLGRVMRAMLLELPVENMC